MTDPIRPPLQEPNDRRLTKLQYEAMLRILTPMNVPWLKNDVRLEWSDGLTVGQIKATNPIGDGPIIDAFGMAIYATDITLPDTTGRIDAMFHADGFVVLTLIVLKSGTLEDGVGSVKVVFVVDPWRENFIWRLAEDAVLADVATLIKMIWPAVTKKDDLNEIVLATLRAMITAERRGLVPLHDALKTWLASLSDSGSQKQTTDAELSVQSSKPSKKKRTKKP